MAIDEKKSALIDRYLHRQLSEAEEEAFQENLQEPEFAREVTFRQMLGRAARGAGRTKLKSFLEAADRELDAAGQPEQAGNTGRMAAWIRWSVAAAVLLAVGAMWWWFSPADNEALFAAHYEAFPNLIAPIDKGTQAEDAAAKALQAYEREGYQEAVALFEALPEMNPEERLYYGLSLLMAGQVSPAIAQLQEVAGNEQARYRQAAQWYLALAYLKAGDRASCETVLDQIIGQEGHRYRGLALALKEGL